MLETVLNYNSAGEYGLEKDDGAVRGEVKCTSDGSFGFNEHGVPFMIVFQVHEDLPHFLWSGCNGDAGIDICHFCKLYSFCLCALEMGRLVAKRQMRFGGDRQLVKRMFSSALWQFKTLL